jgi:hypothetical protein
MTWVELGVCSKTDGKFSASFSQPLFPSTESKCYKEAGAAQTGKQNKWFSGGRVRRWSNSSIASLILSWKVLGCLCKFFFSFPFISLSIYLDIYLI